MQANKNIDEYYKIIENLDNESKLQLILRLQKSINQPTQIESKDSKIEDFIGVFSNYADKSKIKDEKEAWKNYLVKKYDN